MTEPAARGSIHEVDREEMAFGTSIYYARFHQRGEGVPRRKILAISRGARAQVGDVIRRYILRDL